MLTWSDQLIWASAVSLGLMILLWFVQILTKKVALVDVGWSLLIGGSFVFYAVTGDGNETRRWIAGTMGALWALRLGGHMLFNRVLSRHEDGRYVEWRKELGGKFQLVMLAFFLAQAVSVPMLAAPHILNSHNPLGPDWLLWIACSLWIVGFLGVFIADRQLEGFKKQSTSKGRVCDVGLWRFSRHPNYFFEWTMWVAYMIMAINAPPPQWAWLALTAPLLMLLLITKISGIPPAEKQALRSRGEAYRRYQRTTSAFVPLPPKPDPEAAR